MTGPHGEILWKPGQERVDAARMTAFRGAAERRFGLDLADQDDLHAWSVANPDDFWTLVWDFCGVVGEGSGSPVVDNGDRMPGARWFPQARLNYAENLLQGRDDAEALVFRCETGETRRLTFGALRTATARLAARLKAEGVGPGDRVAGFMPNLPETIIAMLAAARLGAVWSSCSPDFGVQGVRDRFGQIEPVVLFCADGYHYGGKTHSSLATVRLLQECLPTLRKTVVVPFTGIDSDLPGDAMAWDDFLASAPEEDPGFARLPFDHPLFIMFSSGTTGLPKCMVHSAGGTLLQHLEEHQLHCDLGPGDRFFYFTTCGWMMWNWLVSGLASGAAVMLYDGHPLKPATTVWDYAADEKFTVLGTSAKWVAACEKAGLRPVDSHDLESLRAVLSTGSPLSPESFDWVYDAVKSDLQLSSISGGTDIISCFALGSPVLPVRRGELQCRGLGMKVEVLDDDGRPATGQKGELVCTAPFPSMPTGFWNDPDGARYHAAYFDRFENVWCHGDFAELTATNGMIIHGRSDTVLNPGGVRIGTAEIYRVVEQFEQVVDSLVVGLSKQDDVEVALFVVLREGVGLTEALADEIRSRIRAENSPRHVPAVVRQAPDIPRTISGKIVELAVRRLLHGQEIDNADALANPQALDFFRDLAPELGADGSS
jgi:acetoacetyl-CoA synthetase